MVSGNKIHFHKNASKACWNNLEKNHYTDFSLREVQPLWRHL